MEKSGANQVPAKAEEKAAATRVDESTQAIESVRTPRTNRNQIIGRGSANFISIWPVSLAQPWLPVSRELYGSFSTDAQSFSFAVQFWPLS